MTAPMHSGSPLHASFLRIFASILAVFAIALAGCQSPPSRDLHRVVHAQVIAAMQEHQIPGMAIAVARDGKVECFSFGVASRESGDLVTPNTIFELGSVSKTFTGLLGAYASEQGYFSFDDAASSHWSELSGSAFDHITLRELATYSAGGLPLQFPDEVVGNTDMVAYFRQWKPSFKAGSRRQYSNPSIALFGHVAAKSASKDFGDMMTGTILPAIGLRDTYLSVPQSAMNRYAFGYNADDQPVRVNPGALDQEAYGIKSTAADMGLYLLAHIQPPSDATLRRAMANARTGRYSVGPMTQALGWEIYQCPVGLDVLLAGNSPEIIFEANAVSSPRVVKGPVLMNKTGSTGGFGAYVAIVPDRKVGVALLANRNFPIADRVKIAHAILELLNR